MVKSLTLITAFAVVVQVVLLVETPPAAAISADLAKKCRDMAIKAHPPELPGGKPYGAAERDDYNKCISNNGQMPDDGPPKSSLPPN
jgi:hypothetical protein